MSGSLVRNAVANVLQMVAGAVLLFALYRFINERLGVAALGVWSVVMATVAASRLADFGIGASMVRFVARDLARDDPKAAAIAVETGLLSVAVVLTLILPLLYFVAGPLFKLVFPGKEIEGALQLLPYALVSLWLGMTSMVSQSALDGCQRMDVRAALVVAGQALMLGLAVLFVPAKGLVGLAWAQIGQGLFLLVVGWLVLRRQLKSLFWIPFRWSWKRLREMLGYGINVQVAGIFMLLFDPITKLLMGRFGGTEAAGYFEMANQFALKARTFIVVANQAVTPKVAEMAERAPQALPKLYRESMRMLLFAVVLGGGFFVIWSGGFTWVLTGGLNGSLVLLMFLCVLGWMLNVFAGPAYFANLGTGRLGWNTAAHIIMGVLNGMLGWWFGNQWGMWGVATAYVLALVVGSWVLVIAYQKRSRISWRGLGLGESVYLLFVGSMASAASFYAWIALAPTEMGIAMLVASVSTFALILAAWLHPMRVRLMNMAWRERTMA